MDLDGGERYAAAALFTLALHATQVEALTGDRPSSYNAAWGCPDEEFFDDLISVGEQEPWPGMEVPHGFWGFDCCAPQGLCRRVYSALGINESRWPGLLKMPDVSHGPDSHEAQAALVALVRRYCALLDPEAAATAAAAVAAAWTVGLAPAPTASLAHAGAEEGAEQQTEARAPEEPEQRRGDVEPQGAREVPQRAASPRSALRAYPLPGSEGGSTCSDDGARSEPGRVDRRSLLGRPERQGAAGEHEGGGEEDAAGQGCACTPGEGAEPGGEDGGLPAAITACGSGMQADAQQAHGSLHAGGEEGNAAAAQSAEVACDGGVASDPHGGASGAAGPSKGDSGAEPQSAAGPSRHLSVPPPVRHDPTHQSVLALYELIGACLKASAGAADGEGDASDEGDAGPSCSVAAEGGRARAGSGSGTPRKGSIARSGSASSNAGGGGGMGSSASSSTAGPLAGALVRVVRKPLVRWYDARARVALRRLCTWLHVPGPKLHALEQMWALQLLQLQPGAASGGFAYDFGAAVRREGARCYGTYLKIGAGALGGAALLAVTGGLAAPAIAAGLSSAIMVLHGGAAAAAAVGTLGASTAGTAAITGTFGVIGASHAGAKTADLYGEVKEFGFWSISEADASVDLSRSGNGSSSALAGSSTGQAGAAQVNANHSPSEAAPVAATTSGASNTSGWSNIFRWRPKQTEPPGTKRTASEPSPSSASVLPGPSTAATAPGDAIGPDAEAAAAAGAWYAEGVHAMRTAGPAEADGSQPAEAGPADDPWYCSTEETEELLVAWGGPLGGVAGTASYPLAPVPAAAHAADSAGRGASARRSQEAKGAALACSSAALPPPALVGSPGPCDSAARVGGQATGGGVPAGLAAAAAGGAAAPHRGSASGLDARKPLSSYQCDVADSDDDNVGPDGGADWEPATPVAAAAAAVAGPDSDADGDDGGAEARAAEIAGGGLAGGDASGHSAASTGTGSARPSARPPLPPPAPPAASAAAGGGAGGGGGSKGAPGSWSWFRGRDKQGGGAAGKAKATGGAGTDRPLLSVPVNPRRSGDATLALTIAVNGWVKTPDDFVRPWRQLPCSGRERWGLVWESDVLRSLGGALRKFIRDKAIEESSKMVVRLSVSWALVTAMMLPLAVMSAINIVIGSRWRVALRRAQLAGRCLAHLLMQGAHGDRPVTLIGFSMGARLIFHCLLELSRCGARGLVESAVLLGAPVSASEARWAAARSAVAGRLVNAFSTNDWVLGVIFRAHSKNSLVSRAAGLGPVAVPGVDNVNLSALVSGHTQYLEKLEDVLSALNLAEV